ncbi:DUF4306 domain-containing protein [Sutcliffiella halmapala]|uniref:DUF4306 domain-containing protein n=1 Tax=Sutcliffiella halmapala TaxID=79882 RepID=UPI0009954087
MEESASKGDVFLKWLVVFLLSLFVFNYYFFFASWTGSYLPYDRNWEEYTIFTPVDINDPRQIYEIDKFVYSYMIEPRPVIISIVSFIVLCVSSLVLIRKLIRYIKEKNKIEIIG